MIETRRGLERDAARVAALMTSCAPGDSTLVVVCPTDAACLDLTAVLRDIGCSARSLLRSSKDSDRRILERELGERSVSTIVTVSDALRRLPAGINAKVLAWEDIEGAGAQPDDVSRAAVALRARMVSGVAIPRHVAWPEHVATASSRIPVTQLAAPGIAVCRTDGLMLVPECQGVARRSLIPLPAHPDRALCLGAVPNIALTGSRHSTRGCERISEQEINGSLSARNPVHSTSHDTAPGSSMRQEANCPRDGRCAQRLVRCRRRPLAARTWSKGSTPCRSAMGSPTRGAGYVSRTWRAALCAGRSSSVAMA